MKEEKTSLATSLAALPFITFNKDQGYKLHREAADLIKSLPDHLNCSILSIVGKAKTGKSYLLNKLISLFKQESACNQKYFPVNDGIGAGTQGIKIFTMNLNGQNVIFLDMEGLGNLASNSEYQGRLFAFTLLLSTVMIYNNNGPLDLQSLQGFGILLEITKMLGNTLANNKNKLQLPRLSVVLRDFALTLENVQGKSITTDQYLQDALFEQKGALSSSSNKNQIKKTIKEMFPHRKCFSFSLPTESIPILNSSPLRPQFQDQLSSFKNSISRQLSTNCKAFNGKKANPIEWLSFAQSLVQLINSQQKQGVLKIQSLLFQAYRRQQGSIRERFSMSAQALSKKAEVKYQQAMSTSSIFSQIDVEYQFFDSVQAEKQLEKVQSQLKQAYILACREMEEMVRKQAGENEVSDYLEYTNPAIAKIKDFAQLYRIFQKETAKIDLLQQQLHQSAKEQQESKKQQQAQKQENDKFARIMEEISLCQTEKQIDAKYLNFIKSLRSSGTNLQSKVLQSKLLKLEVVYLRRKLECSNREQVAYSNCQKQPEKQINEKKFGSALKEKVDNKLMTQKRSVSKYDSQSNQSKLYTFHSKEVSPFEGNQQTNKNQAFLVPYITISLNQINIQIIRTLVKQDNRGSSYFQYVLEVVLDDKRWVFNRRWKDFNELHSILNQLYPIEILPEFLAGAIAINNPSMTKKQQIEIRRAQLEDYLRNLIELEPVRNSRIMQKFLKINKQYVPYL